MLPRVDTGLLDALIGGGFIPVVAPLARGEDGSVYNVNADTVAGQVAAALGAEKLVYLTDVEGLYRHLGDDGSLFPRSTLTGVEEMLEGGEVTGGMLPKLRSCVAAMSAGVRPGPHPRWEGAARPPPRDIHPGRDRDHGGAGPGDMTVMDRAGAVADGHLPAPPRGLRTGRGLLAVGRGGEAVSRLPGRDRRGRRRSRQPRRHRRSERPDDQTLVHVSNMFYTVPMVELAERLAGLSGLGRVFFANCGATANETALKLARAWGRNRRGPDCFEVVSLLGSFHGRTLGALAATGQPTLQAPFAPMPNGFTHVPPGRASRNLERAVTSKTAAVMVETIQGEGGVVPLDPGYLAEVRSLCDERDVLMIVDDVQAGMGRTGTWFSWQDLGFVPDVATVAKALGNGFPIGACLAREEVASVFQPR